MTEQGTQPESEVNISWAMVYIIFRLFHHKCAFTRRIIHGKWQLDRACRRLRGGRLPPTGRQELYANEENKMMANLIIFFFHVLKAVFSCLDVFRVHKVFACNRKAGSV